jgi:hypothetical protein
MAEKHHSQTHGKSRTKEYRTWSNMMTRCNNENYKDFKNYGGRGISVCERWVKFINFYEDMGGQKRGMTLDRIDCDKNYSLENCKWSTMKEQENNRTNNHRVTFKGETKTLMQWSESLGIKYSTLGMRLLTYGWSVEKALTTKVR